MKRIGKIGLFLLALAVGIVCLASCEIAGSSVNEGPTLSLTAAETPIAEGTEADGTTWKVYGDGSMTVDGVVTAMYDYDLKGETPSWKAYADQVTSITFGENVKDISGYAFSDMKNVIWVDFGGVKTVGYNAFENCVNLRRVVTPATLTTIEDCAFLGCYRLREVILTGVTSLGTRAFGNCVSLVSVKQPAALSGSEDAYLGSDQIVEISTGSSARVTTDENGFLMIGATVVGYDGRATAVVIPSAATAIAPYAFYANTQLTSVTIPDGVISIGANAFAGCTSLETLSIGTGVQLFGENVFQNCHSLTTLTFNATTCKTFPTEGMFAEISTLSSVTIGGGVTALQDGMFRGCTALAEVSLPAGLKTVNGSLFEGCTSLCSVTIDEGATTIGEAAFKGCSSLKTLTLPASVTTIRAEAFRGSGLYQIDLSGVRSVQQFAFQGCASLCGVVLGSNTNVNSDGVFSGCYKLTDVVNHSSRSIAAGKTTNGYVAYYTDFKVGDSGDASFRMVRSGDFLFMRNPENTEEVYLIGYVGDNTRVTLPVNYQGSGYIIHRNAFRGNCTIETVTLTVGVTGIEEGAFRDCLRLTTVNGVAAAAAEIGAEAFRGCVSLQTVTFPADGLTAIGEAAFYQCVSLKNITVPDTVETLGASAFQDSGIQTLTLGMGIAQIPEKLCSGCENLTTVTVNGSVASISDFAFTGCIRLEEMELPEGLTTIGNYAFFGDTRLLTVVFPDSVTSVGVRAYENCHRLTSVTVGTGLTTIGAYAFNGCENLIEVVNPGNTHLVLEAGKVSNGLLARNALNIVTQTEITTDGDYLFILRGTAYYLLAYLGDETVLTLPANKDGRGYTIAPYAFAYTPVTQVTLGNLAIRVGAHAFDGSSLEVITLSEPLQAIDAYAFANTPLKDITFKGTYLTSIADLAFQNCRNLVFIDIKGGNLDLGFGCFTDCIALTQVTFSAQVSSVGAFCFDGCLSLPQLIFPSSVKSFGEYWYADCYGLTEIVNLSTSATVGGINSSNSSVKNNVKVLTSSRVTNVDGYLMYNKTTLIGYIGTETDLVLPEIVGGYSIGAYAFYGRTDISSVRIASSVVSIGDYAFAGCTSLSAVYLSKDTIIGQDGVGAYIFYGCSEDLAIGTDAASREAFPSNWNETWYAQSINPGHEYRVTGTYWASQNAGQSYVTDAYRINYGLSYEDFMTKVTAGN